MKKFKAQHNYGTEWEFLVEMNEKVEISFDIVKTIEGEYVWMYHLHEIDKEQWRGCWLKNQLFDTAIDVDENEEEIKEIINKGFYELLRQIKEDSTWRLKVMHMLDDEIRKVWNIV